MNPFLPFITLICVVMFSAHFPISTHTQPSNTDILFTNSLFNNATKFA